MQKKITIANIQKDESKDTIVVDLIGTENTCCRLAKQRKVLLVDD